MIRTAVVGLFLLLYILLVAPFFILHCLVTRRVERLYRAGVGGAVFALRLGGIRVRVEGAENIPEGPCVFAANHASNADPPAIVGAIPKRVALLAKKEVFKVPILSRALRLADFVCVDRANKEAARASVEEALERLARGLSFLIFAEGTRSPDGRLRPFKKGAFILAVRAGVPVVPVTIANSHLVMGKASFAIRPGEVLVKFHAPIDARRFTMESAEELIAQTQAAVASALPEDQQPVASAAAESGEGE